MHHYRIGLWVENQGQIPDFYMEIRTNVLLSIEGTVALAMKASGRHFVKRASIEMLSPRTWREERLNIMLWGGDNLYVSCNYSYSS
jgi:hypothetical protein